MSLHLDIHKALASDVPDMMELENLIFAHHAWSTENMLRDVTDENCVYLVAYAHTDALGGDATLAGYVGVLSPAGAQDADIQTLAVNPVFRSQGIGRKLLADAMGIASGRGARQLFLEVRADNEIALGLYRSVGFEDIGVREHYYQPEGVDAVVMKRALP